MAPATAGYADGGESKSHEVVIVNCEISRVAFDIWVNGEHPRVGGAGLCHRDIIKSL